MPSSEPLQTPLPLQALIPLQSQMVLDMLQLLLFHQELLGLVHDPPHALDPETAHQRRLGFSVFKTQALLQALPPHP